MIAGALGMTGSSRYTLDDMAADAVGLLDELDVDRAHVVGVSMGGMIGQTLAARHPERVASLASIMSGPGGRRPSVMPRLSVMGTLLAKPPVEREAYATHVARIFTRIGSPGFEHDYERLRERVLMMYDRCFYPTGTARQLMAIMASGDRTEELRRIHCPTLVIHGKADKLMPTAAGEAVARAVPAARLELIEGMGHDLPVQLWPRVTRSIADNAARAKPAPRTRPPPTPEPRSPNADRLRHLRAPDRARRRPRLPRPGDEAARRRRRDAGVERPAGRLGRVRHGDAELDLGLLRAPGRVPRVAARRPRRRPG